MKRSNEFLQIESDDEQELHSQVPTSHRVSSSSAPAAVERTRPVNNRRIVTEEVIESHIPYISDDTVQWDIAKFKKPTDKELNYWNQLSNELKNQFLKSIIRFFLMKASKNENISRSHIIDTLKPIGNEYRQVTNAILYNAQEKLYNVFGYIVCQSKRILLNHNGKNDEYFLSNAIKSPKLQSIIHNQHENTKAFRAFVFLVCQFIYVSPGKSIDAASLLKHLNMLDSRFPVTILIDDKKQNKNKATAPIPELDDNFLGLMNRMKRQGFVTSPKEDETEPGRVKYELGPRFYNDLGVLQLVKAHFAIKSEVAPEAILETIKTELNEFLAEIIDSEELDVETLSKEPASQPVSSQQRSTSSELKENDGKQETKGTVKEERTFPTRSTRSSR